MNSLTCPFCDKTFKIESRFLTHQCKEKTRFELSKTLAGTRGYALYVKWFQLQNRGLPSKDAFLASKHFKPMIEFAEFVQRVKMSDPEYYIRAMIKKDFPPTMWCLDATYTMYLENIVYNLPPSQQITKTVKFLTKLCEKMDCGYQALIESMEAEEILFFIRQGEISPWIVMHSMKLKEVFLDDDHTHEYQQLKQLIKPAYWKYRFSKDPSMVQLAKSVVAEMCI